MSRPAKDPRALAIRLIAWAQEEGAAQRRLEAALADQERAIRAVDTDAIVATGERVRAELRAAPERERRRAALAAELGRAFGADPRALTLGSVAERLERSGAGTREAESLRSLRGDLRAVASRVARRGRRIAGLARHHADVLGELMRTLCASEGSEDGEDAVLLDARG